jgi:2-oxoglutarate ferredoxin oxidoreductase subunit alpha
MELAWQCQVPAFVLVDKTLSEGTYSVDLPPPDDPAKPGAPAEGAYHRYADTGSGISPLAFAGTPGAVVKVNSYAHDEYGITTEDAAVTKQMADKRTRKGEALVRDLARYPQVNVSGVPDAATAILCWGSTAGVCAEAGTLLGLRVVRPVVLAPFPVRQLGAALSGVNRVIAVEENSAAQLAGLARDNGITVHDTVLRYDGRPFAPDDLAWRLREVLS